MTRFTDQKPLVATEDDIMGPWSGGKNGKYFYCRLCGYKFEVGDVYRWVNLVNRDPPLPNILVCQSCDGTNDEVYVKALEHHKIAKALYGHTWDEVK